jgi:hypothetical protein
MATDKNAGDCDVRRAYPDIAESDDHGFFLIA